MRRISHAAAAANLRGGNDQCVKLAFAEIGCNEAALLQRK
jgi:hypothetical protein